jgi:hypothetical protein
VYRGVGANRAPHMLCHGDRKAPPGKTDTVTATIHSSLAGCKIEVPNPFAKACEKYESSVGNVARVTVGILYQPDGKSARRLRGSGHSGPVVSGQVAGTRFEHTRPVCMGDVEWQTLVTRLVWGKVGNPIAAEQAHGDPVRDMGGSQAKGQYSLGGTGDYVTFELQDGKKFFVAVDGRGRVQLHSLFQNVGATYRVPVSLVGLKRRDGGTRLHASASLEAMPHETIELEFYEHTGVAVIVETMPSGEDLYVFLTAQEDR